MDALARLYRQLNGPLRYYGQQIIANQSIPSINDILQELFLWIAKHPHKLKTVDNLEAYLFATLRENIYRAFFRKNQQKKYQDNYLKSLSDKDQLTSPIEEAIVQADNKRTQKEWIQYQLSQIAPSQREVLYLKYFNQLSYQEIAQIMKISEQVARNYAYRGIQQLRKDNSEFPYLE